MATISKSSRFLPSLDEARLLSGKEEPEDIIDWCHALGTPIVAVKRGAHGVTVSDGRRIE